MLKLCCLGWNVFVSGENKNFVDDWKPLLLRLGASASSGSKSIEKALAKIDLVVADEKGQGKEKAVTSKGVTEAHAKGIVVVTPEWVIQSLINGGRVKYDDFRVQVEN